MTKEEFIKFSETVELTGDEVRVVTENILKTNKMTMQGTLTIMTPNIQILPIKQDENKAISESTSEESPIGTGN